MMRDHSQFSVRFSRFSHLRPLVIALTLAVPVSSSALAGHPAQQAAPGADPSDQVPPGAEVDGYVGEDMMIPARDGVKLHVQVWRPRDSTGKLPILMTRSPYGFNVKRLQYIFDGPYRELVTEKFIFVLADIRGRFGSQGQFVMLRPRAAPGGVDESTDTWDTIDWLVKSLPDNNGKVGVFGGSYAGWTAAMATIDPHPALKAISAQASPEDMFIGDDFLHNGALRLDYAWSYSASLETDGRTSKPFSYDEDDLFDWYLKQKDLATLDQQHLGLKLPTWQNFVAHPTYDAFWKARRTSHMMPAKVAVPNLIVAGWWDQEDFYGPLKMYENQEKGDAQNLNYLVVGPWNHGGWLTGDGGSYGPFQLGSQTALWFRQKVEMPWWRYWLKGVGTLDQPEALIFESGSNIWKREKSWPPREGTTRRNLYLHAGGKLSFDAPGATEPAADRFVSDPANPVPYRERPLKSRGGSTWSVWLADDQAPFARRKDVLSWQTDPLPEDVAIEGNIAAKLFASTTGSDADWVVKLIDVYPSDETTPAELRGRQRMIANDILRGRFRTGFETPRPITPGAVLDYHIDLHAASHVFKKGHRIAVQIQSSWFPLIARNPQTYVANVLRAKPEDFKARTHAIYHTPRRPSAISVSVETP
uniref:CocE/NonD family hydrolase n=1 Tax=Sphingomonas bacterium TaxID=1895847 RepID=UPI0026342249|nr:CocE/NonD family hydrolase [Sphingomonas bacterium]